MIQYLITTYPHASGANLSKPGHWGNIPHTSVEAAKRAAKEDAGASAFTIETRHIAQKKGK